MTLVGWVSPHVLDLEYPLLVRGLCSAAEALTSCGRCVRSNPLGRARMIVTLFEVLDDSRGAVEWTLRVPLTEHPSPERGRESEARSLATSVDEGQRGYRGRSLR